MTVNARFDVGDVVYERHDLPYMMRGAKKHVVHGVRAYANQWGTTVTYVLDSVGSQTEVFEERLCREDEFRQALIEETNRMIDERQREIEFLMKMLEESK